MSNASSGVSAERELAVQGWERESRIIDELKRQLADAAARRDQHVRALHDTNLPYRDIADLLGVSPSRVGQIMARITTRHPRVNGTGPTPPEGGPDGLLQPRQR